MIKLNPNNYYKLLEPLKQVEINHLFALAVVKQNINGEVYVDNIENPSSFYVIHPYGMSLLFGAINNTLFNNKLISYILNIELVRKKTEYLQVFPHAWHLKLKTLLTENLYNKESLKSSGIIEHGRVNFKFNKEKYYSNHHTLITNFEIRRTHKHSFRSMEGFVIPRFFYNNEEQFKKEGVGFSAYIENKPISTAFAAFIQNGQLELGIETLSEYRGKGLAKKVCSALIKYSLQHNLEPVWACRTNNIGSHRLAQSLGFEPIFEIPYYELPIV